MSIKAVYFDFGGVIARTEDKEPRAHLGKEFGRSYREMDQVVFENDSNMRATVGEITEDQHWQNVIASLGLPKSEIPRVREAFFAGDSLDHDLLAFIRNLRPRVKVGLISNAWSGLRAWIERQKFADAFDYMTISAEIGIGKPAPGIYQHALGKLGVQAHEAIFVDDMPANIEGCKAIGMQGILFKSAEQVMTDIKKLIL